MSSVKAACAENRLRLQCGFVNGTKNADVAAHFGVKKFPALLKVESGDKWEVVELPAPKQRKEFLSLVRSLGKSIDQDPMLNDEL